MLILSGLDPLYFQEKAAWKIKSNIFPHVILLLLAWFV